MTREEVLLWMKAAEEDLYDAELALKNRRWFRAAFFAQQAVEKILKVLYIFLGREPPPKPHRVTVIYEGLRETGFMLPAELERKLPVLNKYYTITRYPDAANGLPSESVDEEEAGRAVGIAVEVFKYAKKELSKHTG